jgi:hypothetical protein
MSVPTIHHVAFFFPCYNHRSSYLRERYWWISWVKGNWEQARRDSVASRSYSCLVPILLPVLLIHTWLISNHIHNVISRRRSSSSECKRNDRLYVATNQIIPLCLELTRKHYTIYHNFSKQVRSPICAYGMNNGWWKGLDKQTLSICVGMIEAGANPDTLAVSTNPESELREIGLMIGCH